MPTHDVVLSNAMHAHGKQALAHFEWMCEKVISMMPLSFVFYLHAAMQV
jgi:hypothetical protein